MKQLLRSKNLPLFAAWAGITGHFLRRFLYIFVMDDKGLLVRNHPLERLLWLLSAVALGYLAIRAWKLDGSAKYEDNFAPSLGAAVGQILAGACFALTALLNTPLLRSGLGSAWKLFGVLSGPCLMLSGISRARGKKPGFLLYMIPCLFMVLHIINHYQMWSGNPQVQDYVFDLFAAMALLLFAYHNAAFSVGSGNRRMQLLTGLAALYLGMVAIGRTEHLFLYAGGLAWVVSGLCSLEPKPKETKGEPHDQT